MLQQSVFDLVQNKGSPLLEPSFGAGHLLIPFLASNPSYPMICYELDTTVKPIITTTHQQLIYGDFTKQTHQTKFRTIIGNPPYVQRRGAVNLYLEFIERCMDLLDGAGAEIVFIVPSDFIKLSRAAPLLERMMATGAFTHFLFPNNEGLFSGAAVDVLVFRYEVGRASTEGTMVNGHPKFCTLTNGIITFADTPSAAAAQVLVSNLFTVHVGLVSGKDEVYKVPFGNIEVLADKDRRERFIFPTSYPTGNAEIDVHLAAHKTALMERRIKKFTEENWFEWGAPRNRQTMGSKKGQPCIYVRTLTRKQEVAFVGTVEPFGGALLCMIPTGPMTPAMLSEITALLNNPNTQKEYLYSGRFKIGQKQLCNLRL